MSAVLWIRFVKSLDEPSPPNRVGIFVHYGVEKTSPEQKKQNGNRKRKLMTKKLEIQLEITKTEE
jgi:hypothetical protein